MSLLSEFNLLIDIRVRKSIISMIYFINFLFQLAPFAGIMQNLKFVQLLTIVLPIIVRCYCKTLKLFCIMIYSIHTS